MPTLATRCSNRQVAQKNSCNISGLFAIIFKKCREARGIWTDSWLLLAGPIWVICFLCWPQWPRMSYFFNGPQWFWLDCVSSTSCYLDFYVAFPTRPDPGNTSTIPLPICWWCWCHRSMAASPSKPAGIRFPLISHLCYIRPQISHLVVALSHLIVALSHLFLGIS